jgi:hypothetical protein
VYEIQVGTFVWPNFQDPTPKAANWELGVGNWALTVLSPYKASS